MISYKKSLPYGWHLVFLEDLAADQTHSIVDGPFGSNLKSEHYRTTGIPVIQSGFVTSNKFIASKYQYVDKELFNQQKRSKVIAGDIVMAKIGAQAGTCAVLPEGHRDSILAGNCLKMSLNARICMSQYVLYVLHYLYSLHGFSSIKSITAQPAISLSQLKKLKILLPSVEEQEKIVSIISAWDEAIAKTEKLITAKQVEKRGFVQRIFKADDSPMIEFCEFVELRKDKFNPSQQGKERICVELEHIAQETGQLIGSTKSTEQSSIKNIFEPGNILFGKLRPYLRKYADPNFSGVCSTEIWVLIAKPLLCYSRYLFYLVQTHEFIVIANKSSGSKMPRADWELVSEQPFPLPSLHKQKKAAFFLDILSHEIHLLQSLKEKLALQKRGLMQKLLTGKWRVTVEKAD